MGRHKKAVHKAAWNCRVDSDVSERAIDILNGLGLTRSAAVNMFASAIVRCNGLPLQVTNVYTEKDDVGVGASVDASAI